MKTESNTNRTYGFSRPWPGKLGYTTAMLGGAVAGILLAARQWPERTMMTAERWITCC